MNRKARLPKIRSRQLYTHAIIRSTVMAMILFLLTVTMPALARQPDKAKLDSFFDRLTEKGKAMGSLAIVKDGQVVYSRSIGYSEINGTDKKALTAANRFRIASITKMFTAAITLQLIEERKLKLTDTLYQFLPQIPNARKITIQQILQHRSGIPNVKRSENGREDINTTPISKDEVLALIAAATPTFEPDTKSGYSNSGYFVLGLIIEKVTGKPYAEVLRKRIIDRIGLKDTYLATGKIDVSKNEVLTYMNFGNGWKQMPETHPSILFSAGAIVSTPNDMARFIQALFDGKIISKASLDQMKTIRDGEGMGMETYSYVGKTFYGHSGGADNYGSWLAYLPEEKLAFAYTTNAKIYPVRDLVNGVVDIYYNKPFQIPSFEAFAVSTDVLDKYVGVYSTPEGPAKFTITREGATLFIKPPGESGAAPLEATAEDKFRIQGAIVVEFDAAKNQMTIKRGGGQRVFTKEK